jgi:hypothetical protein
VALELKERERRARHEAAHVVCAVAEGHEVLHADLSATEIKFIHQDDEAGLHKALRSCSVLLAGRIVDPAEELADVLGVEHNDWDRAYRIARASVGEDHVRPLLRAATERAETLLDESSDLHHRLTAELLERGSLGAQEIRLIKENSNGIEPT